MDGIATYRERYLLDFPLKELVSTTGYTVLEI